MREVKLENGNVLKVCSGSYADASKLKSLIIAELTRKGLKLPSGKGDIKDFMKKDIDSDIASTILSSVLELEGNEEITNQIIVCAKKSLLNDEKITVDTFEDSKLWPILLEVKIEVIKENVIPFFLNLLSIVKRQIGNLKLDSILK